MPVMDKKALSAAFISLLQGRLAQPHAMAVHAAPSEAAVAAEASDYARRGDAERGWRGLCDDAVHKSEGALRMTSLVDRVT